MTVADLAVVATMRAIAREGRTAVLAFAQETGADPLALYELLARRIARDADHEDEREAAMQAAAAAKRLEERRGRDLGNCSRCRARGTPERPLQPLCATGPYFCRACVRAFAAPTSEAPRARELVA
jgi:hypothetical protein